MDQRLQFLAEADVADDIEELYNPTRHHTYLGGLSPDQFEATQKSRHRTVHSSLGTPRRQRREPSSCA